MQSLSERTNRVDGRPCRRVGVTLDVTRLQGGDFGVGVECSKESCHLMRILVADDHELIRHGLRRILESHSGWEICAEAATGGDALRLAYELRPDVVIMDISLPDVDGIQLTRDIRARLPGTQVLILTMHESARLVEEAQSAGASGYVVKSDAGSRLVNALERPGRARDSLHVRRTTAATRASALGTADTVPYLTAREVEVVKGIGDGLSSKDLALTLGISAKTVDTHRANVMRKLDLHSVSELVRYAIRTGLVAP